MSDKVSSVNKPQLRGLLHNQIKRNLFIAMGLCISAAVIQKFFYNDIKIKRYADFYKTYDINKTFNEMRNKGLFDSCEPDN